MYFLERKVSMYGRGRWFFASKSLGIGQMWGPMGRHFLKIELTLYGGLFLMCRGRRQGHFAGY
jgi:hypothetical protein